MKPMKDHFKSAPEDFRQSIDCAVREAKQKKTLYRRPASAKRIAILAAVFAALVLPLSIFGYSIAKERSLKAEQPKKHVIRPVVVVKDEAKPYSPDFVKLDFTIPEGYVESDYSEGMKFHHADEEEKRISTGLTRSLDGTREPVKFTTASEEFSVNGRDALMVYYGDGTGYNRRVYLFFHEVNMFFDSYFTASVTEEEIMAFLETVKVEEGTAENCTLYGVYDSSVPHSFSDGSIYKDGLKYCRAELTPLGTEMNLRTEVVGKVENVQVVKNVAGKDLADFNFNRLEVSECIDGSGNLLVRVSDEWSWEGEGVIGEDYMPEFIRSEEYEQSFVIATLTYTNTSSEIAYVDAGPDLLILEKGADGDFYYSNARKGDKNFFDGGITPNYIEGVEEWDPAWGDYDDYLAGKISDPRKLIFNVCRLDPGETRTVTVGWRCDTELLDRAYLSSYQIYTNNQYPYYVTKVTENGI